MVQVEQNEETIVVYGMDNEEVLPLSIHNRYEGSVENHEGSMDKVDMHLKISKVVIEGHLSPTQVEKMKDKVAKNKNQGEKDNVGAQASSRQSKRTIIKKFKYQWEPLYGILGQ